MVCLPCIARWNFGDINPVNEVYKPQKPFVIDYDSIKFNNRSISTLEISMRVCKSTNLLNSHVQLIMVNTLYITSASEFILYQEKALNQQFNHPI